MDLGTTIIGVVVTLLCVLPFILFSFYNSKKRKANFQVLTDLTKSKNYHITQKDNWKQHVIGIDESRKVLFFSKNPTDIHKFVIIDLKKVENCRLIKENPKGVLNRLALEIEFSDKKLPDNSLEFYNSDTSVSLVNELELIQKWHTIINKNRNP